MPSHTVETCSDEGDWTVVMPKTSTVVVTASSQLEKDHDALQYEFRVEYLALLAQFVTPLAKVDRKKVPLADRIAVDATIGREELCMQLKYRQLAGRINSKYQGTLLPWELEQHSNKWHVYANTTFQDMETRNCIWRSIHKDQDGEGVIVVISTLGFTLSILSVVAYAAKGFIFEWNMGLLIIGMGAQLLIMWVLAFYSVAKYFAINARHRSLEPSDFARQPGRSYQGILWVIPTGINLSLWVTALVLQGATLAKGNVEGSVVCLLPTLAMVLIPFPAVFVARKWSRWGALYSMGRQIPLYEELYGRTTGNNGGL